MNLWYYASMTVFAKIWQQFQFTFTGEECVCSLIVAAIELFYFIFFFPFHVRLSSVMAEVILLMLSSCISLISPWNSWGKPYSFYEDLYSIRQLHCAISLTSTSDSLSTHVMEWSLSVWNIPWCVHSQSLMLNFTSCPCNSIYSSGWQLFYHQIPSSQFPFDYAGKYIIRRHVLFHVLLPIKIIIENGSESPF